VTTRIKGSDTSAVDAGATRTVERVRRSAPAGQATGAAPGAHQAESVSITDTARRLAALQVTIAGLPEVDANRTTELRQAIERGQYQANPAKIADRLLQLENDLANAGQRRKS
jgi:negative regulator of flagellin synthesis FlgM